MIPKQSSAEPATTSGLDGLLKDVLLHLDAGLTAAQQGLDEAERAGNSALEQFFHRCVLNFRRTQADVDSLVEVTGDSWVPVPSPAKSEQVSAATFAAGDGATDDEVVPTEGRGKPGNWPAY